MNRLVIQKDMPSFPVYGFHISLHEQLAHLQHLSDFLQANPLTQAGRDNQGNCFSHNLVFHFSNTQFPASITAVFESHPAIGPLDGCQGPHHTVGALARPNAGFSVASKKRYRLFQPLPAFRPAFPEWSCLTFLILHH